MPIRKQSQQIKGHIARKQVMTNFTKGTAAKEFVHQARDGRKLIEQTSVHIYMENQIDTNGKRSVLAHA
jgi:hypothetical protein